MTARAASGNKQGNPYAMPIHCKRCELEHHPFWRSVWVCKAKEIKWTEVNIPSLTVKLSPSQQSAPITINYIYHDITRITINHTFIIPLTYIYCIQVSHQSPSIITIHSSALLRAKPLTAARLTLRWTPSIQPTRGLVQKQHRGLSHLERSSEMVRWLGIAG